MSERKTNEKKTWKIGQLFLCTDKWAGWMSMFNWDIFHVSTAKSLWPERFMRNISTNYWFYAFSVLARAQVEVVFNFFFACSNGVWCAIAGLSCPIRIHLPNINKPHPMNIVIYYNAICFIYAHYILSIVVLCLSFVCFPFPWARSHECAHRWLQLGDAHLSTLQSENQLLFIYN